MKSEQFHRRGFKEVRDKVENTITDQYQSEVVDDLKASNYIIERDNVKVHLAKVSVVPYLFVLVHSWDLVACLVVAENSQLMKGLLDLLNHYRTLDFVGVSNGASR